MNWLADVGSMLLGPEQPATKAPAEGITIFANGAASSDGSGEEEIEAQAESELARLNLGGDLGDADSREGYLEEVRAALFQPAKLSKYMGMDVTSLMSVPLFIMEPFSMLQKMAEIMEYSDLLNQADAAADPLERIALVAAFLVSPFGAAERAWKPFNPLLGETFELEGLSNNVRFLAEQVSHHPPVSAAHAENAAFTYDLVSAPATKFLGNSLEVYPKGRTRITLRSWGETYSHVPPTAKVHNLVVGRTWVDSFGTFLVSQPGSGRRVELEFKPCGWFGSGQYEFEGHVFDGQGEPHFCMSGKWNSFVDLAPCSPDGSPVEGAEKRRLWTCADKPEGDAYGCTHFALELNSCKHLSRPPLASDSRRRADRLALEQRRMGAAAAEKGALEEEQRQEGKVREERGEQWQARYFEPAPDMEVLPGEEPAEAVPLWRWNGKYGQQARDAMPAGGSNWQDDVCGQGFVPWQFRSRPVDAAASRASSRASSKSPSRKPRSVPSSPTKAAKA